MKRLLILFTGILCYAVGMGGLTCFILFVGGWSFLPVHIDSGMAQPLPVAIGINAALLLLFGLQHSIMARPRFKALWTRIIPEPLERSVYVFFSGLILLVLCLGWQRVHGSLWHIEALWLQSLVLAIQILGWSLAVFSSFIISHWELFGIQQVCSYWNQATSPRPEFVERSLYAWVRHPLQLGILIGLWATPSMTVSHFLLSAGMTVYILIGLSLEEKDLAASLGEPYEDYRSRVRMLIPVPRSPERKPWVLRSHSFSNRRV